MRQISAELRELRLRRGLSAEEVARSLGISASKLSRLESGHRAPQPDDVAALLGLYRVSAEHREALLALVRSSQERNWWQPRDSELPALWKEIIRLEKGATALRNYETVLVCGLLQTEEYATAVARGLNPDLKSHEVRALVEARMSRQSLLRSRTAPLLEAFVEQSALERRVGGPAVAARQLWHLASLSTRDNVIVHVLPATIDAHPGLGGPFVLMEFDKHPSLVYLEHRGNSAFLENSEHVAEAQDALRCLRKLALSADDSVDLIVRIADGMIDSQGAHRGTRGPVPCLLENE
jgi:transcriptional regulator with XRE-family HTH domain